jgi:hypothetical protein
MRKLYLIDLVVVDSQYFYDTLENDTRYECEYTYDEMLDETYGEVVIGSCSFYPSEIMKQMDEIAYNVGFDDYVDAQLGDNIYEVEEFGEVLVGGCEYKIIDLEYDDEYYYEIEQTSHNEQGEKVTCTFNKIGTLGEVLVAYSFSLDDATIEALENELASGGQITLDNYTITRHEGEEV